MRSRLLVVLFLLLLSARRGAEAKFVRDTLEVFDGRNFVYLTKFCFDGNDGKIVMQINNNNKFGRGQPSLAFYSDREEDWFSVYQTDLDCIEKRNKANKVLSFDVLNQNNITLSVLNARPRWWWIVATNCEADNETGLQADAMDFDYKITMLNRKNKENERTWHFGADQLGVLEMSVAFLIAYGMLMILAGFDLYTLISRKMRVWIFIPFVAATVTEFLAQIAYVVHYNEFSIDGVGFPGLPVCGNILQGVAELFVLGAILVIIRGYPISTSYLPGRRLLILILTVFFFVYVALFVVALAVIDEAVNYYLYDTVPGYILCAFRLILLIYSLVELKRTYHHSRDKGHRKFYLFFGGYVVFWMCALPITVIVAHVLGAWVRFKIIFALEGVLRFITLLIMLVTFSPCSPFFVVLEHGDRVAFGRNKMQIFPEIVEFDNVTKAPQNMNAQFFSEAERYGMGASSYQTAGEGDEDTEES